MKPTRKPRLEREIRRRHAAGVRVMWWRQFGVHGDAQFRVLMRLLGAVRIDGQKESLPRGSSGETRYLLPQDLPAPRSPYHDPNTPVPERRPETTAEKLSRIARRARRAAAITGAA
jgi:hypothetical protein